MFLSHSVHKYMFQRFLYLYKIREIVIGLPALFKSNLSTVLGVVDMIEW